MKVIIGIIFAILAYGGLMYLGIYLWKNYIKAINIDSLEDLDNLTTSDVFDIKDIKDRMIVKKDEYSAVIEVSSLNIGLMTDYEAESVERMFERMLNKCSFPITLHIQTTPLDNESLVNDYIEKASEVVRTFPHLEDKAEMYAESLRNLPNKMRRTTHKTKYIIVSYKPEDLEYLETDSEKEYHIIDKLSERCDQIISDLEGMKLNAQRLSDVKLFALLYSSLQRQNSLLKDKVAKGIFETNIVKKKNKTYDTTDSNLDLSFMETINKIELTLYDAQVKIKTDSMEKASNKDLVNEYKEVIKELLEVQKRVIEIRENHS